MSSSASRVNSSAYSSSAGGRWMSALSGFADDAGSAVDADCGLCEAGEVSVLLRAMLTSREMAGNLFD
jgi:hypothetical protein